VLDTHLRIQFIVTAELNVTLRQVAVHCHWLIILREGKPVQLIVGGIVDNQYQATF
jgi:hypothetical protein